MNAASIALLILSLILPAGSDCFPEATAADPGAGLKDGPPVPARAPSNERIGIKEAQNSSVRWYPRQSNIEPNGIALVVHGLNCRPDKMAAIIAKLTASGIDCLNLSLRGHGENYAHLNDTTGDEARLETFKSVSYQLWNTEIKAAYQLAKRKSNLYGTPLFLIGFSMGGLLGVDLLASNPNVVFDRMVLFAPALKMRPRNRLLKILSPFPKLVVPSIAHRSYLTNDGTPMAAYNALFEMQAHFEINLNLKINIPTVVFIDEQDELISFSSLQKMIRNKDLDQWKIHPVKKDDSATGAKMHHLIIDEASVGKKMWQEIVDATLAHVLDGPSAATVDE